MCMHERRAAAFAAILDSLLADGIALDGISAIALGYVEIGKALDETRNASARRLHFNGNRNRVAVVLNQVEQRELFGAGGIKRLPEFAFAGGAVPGRHIDDLVRRMADMLAKRSCIGL